MKIKLKFVKGILLLGLQVLLIFLIGTDLWVIWVSQHQLYSNLDDLPHADVALVLGTSRYLKGGGQNLFFSHRMEAAGQLYHNEKIKHLLLSGDNRHQSYNEPVEMRKALRELGVPDEAMTLDYAGFRTFDSVVRASRVFQQNRIIVVSQKFHNERAIAIGKAKGIEVVGYNATDVPTAYGFKVMLREFGARGRLVLDILLDRSPHFLGSPVDIEIGNSI
jgi:SanA protein